MSETREQFRYRISQVAWAKSWSPENPQRADVASKHAMPDMAEAVYREALLDVMDLFIHLEVEDASIFPPDVEIAKYAKRLGINLEDTP